MPSFPGQAGGLAASAGAAAFAGPLGWGLAAAGLGLGLFQGIQQNKAIKRQNEAIAAGARTQFSAIDQNIQSARRSYYDQTSIASQQARSGVQAYQNSLNFASGQSLNEYIAQKVADVSVDQLARTTALQDTETAAQTQKQSIANQASAGMQSGGVPILSGISGAIGGFQLGQGLDNAIAQNRRVNEVNTTLSALLPRASAGDADALAQIQAIEAGVSPAMATGAYSNVFTRPFQIQNELQGLQLQGAQSAAAWSAIRLDSIRRQFNTTSDELLRFLR